MLITELKSRRNVILKENEIEIFTLFPVDEDEVKEMEELFELGSNYKNDERSKNYDFAFFDKENKEPHLEMGGKLDEVKTVHISALIPKIKVHKIRDSEFRTKFTITNEFKCYQEHKSISLNNNIIKHEEQLSSFRCACERIQTINFIVLKEYKTTVKETIENYGNSES